MQAITTQEELNDLLASEDGVLLLFGGSQCAVCHSIKPQLEAIVAQHFPKMVCRYIDCQSQGLALCSQSGVLSLPVVKLYFGGQLSVEFVRTFAMSQVKEAIVRPYAMLFD